jgi:hypothetical protein
MSARAENDDRSESESVRDPEDEPLEAADDEEDEGLEVRESARDDKNRDPEESDVPEDDDEDEDSAPIIAPVEERHPQAELDMVKGAAEEIIVIPIEKRRTSQIMSLSEYTEAISLRTEQISTDGMSSAMIDEIPAQATTARDIAIAEIKARRCPLKIVRHVGRAMSDDGRHIKNYAEIWSPNEMTHPPFQ